MESCSMKELLTHLLVYLNHELKCFSKMLALDSICLFNEYSIMNLAVNLTMSLQQFEMIIKVQWKNDNQFILDKV